MDNLINSITRRQIITFTLSGFGLYVRVPYNKFISVSECHETFLVMKVTAGKRVEKTQV